MNAIVLPISESASAISATAAGTQTLGARGSGGFGATLAAAQALSSALQTASGEFNGGSSGAAPPSVSTNVTGQIPALANLAPKKIPSTNAVANSSHVAGIFISPAVTPIPLPSLLARVSQPAGPQLSIPAALPDTSTQIPTLATGTIQGALAMTGEEIDSIPPAGNSMLPPTARTLVPPGNSANARPSLAAVAWRTQAPSSTSVAVPAGAAATGPPEVEVLADNIEAPLPVASTISTSSESATSDSRFHFPSAVPSTTVAEVTAPSPVFTPSASGETAAVLVASASTLDPADLSPGNPAIDEASAVTATTPVTAVPEQASALPDTANPLSAILSASAPTSSPAISNPLAAAITAQSAPHVAPDVAPVRPDRGTSSKVQASSPTDPHATSASLLSDTPGEADPSSLASQTPFAVFFSSPGPGAESAASTLPKMILPGSGIAVRGSHALGSDSPSAHPQTASQDGPGHNAASRESASASDSGNASTSPSPRHDADPNQAVIDAAVPQGAVAQAPATPVAATASPGAAAVMVTDTTAKTAPLPDVAAAAEKPAAPIAETMAATAAAPVQMAQLISRPDISEMRIGINTAAFGNVEVRTVVRANDVGLVIGSDKGDLRGLLQSDMPAIANTLQEQNLRLHTVNFMQGFAFSNAASGGGSRDSQPRSFFAGRASPDSVLSEAAANPSPELSPMADFSGGSLSILA